MQTTLNIKTDIMVHINRAAELRGISRSALIILLLKKMMGDPSNATRIGRLIEYQKREAPGSSHPFHICFREDEVEFFQDLRKLLKKSLSLVLAEAVKKYLKSLLKKAEITDNYPHANYIIIKEMISTITSWRLIWGFPPDLANIIQQFPK